MDPKWKAFSAIAMANVTTVLTMSMTLLVLPAIADTFTVTLGTVGWVVIIESLIIAAMLLPTGGLADILGRRRVMVAGMTTFGVGAILVGLAPTFTMLILARVVMATGNTLVQSVGTGLTVAAFPPHERGLALGSQTTSVAVGSVSGPLLGGWALDELSWQTLFLLIAIPAFLSAAAARLLISPSVETTGDRRPFDRPGAALCALAIAGTVVSINNPFDLAWTSPWMLGGIAATVGCMVAFVMWELRTTAPMLELRLFAISAFRQGVLVRVFGFLTATAVRFLLPIYLLTALQLSGKQTGAIIALTAVGLGVAAQISGRVYDRVGPRLPAIVGIVIQTVGLIALSFADLETSLWMVTGCVLLLGLSMGLWNVPTNSAMMGATPPEALGVGGAFTNVTRTIGGTIGQSLAAAIVVMIMVRQGVDIPLGDVADTPAALAAFIDGFGWTLRLAAVATALTLLVAVRLPGRS